jgi:hypothetical protein
VGGLFGGSISAEEAGISGMEKNQRERIGATSEKEATTFQQCGGAENSSIKSVGSTALSRRH